MMASNLLKWGGRNRLVFSSLSDLPVTSISRRLFSMMRSVAYDSAGALSIDSNTPKPTLRSGELLIKVHACGVNRLDLLQRVGKYPVPPGESTTLGVEIAGVVAEVDAEARSKCSLQPGDKVCALVGGGGYAEYCTSPYQTCIRIPDGMSFTDAASVPEAFLTAYSALYWSGQLRPGNSVLVHAAGSGVGVAAIQLVKQNDSNSQVFGTAGSDTKLSFCRELGADHIINYKTQDFAEEVASFTDKKGVDVILDFVGAPYWEKNLASIALDGRIVLLGLLGGPMTEKGLNLGAVLRKRVQLTGTTLRSRSLDYKGRLVAEFEEHCLPLFKAGKLRPVVDSVFSIEEAEAAHQRVKDNKNLGKVILTV